MKVTLPLVLETLHALALALWVGGEVAIVVLTSIGISSAPHIYIVRELALIELAGIGMLGVQFLTRRRYKVSKAPFVADGIRHLLTFAALLLAEYVKNGISSHSLGVMASPSIGYSVAGAQILLLTAVSGITMWLQAASARLAVAAPAVSPPTTAQPAVQRPRPATQPARGKKR